MDKCHYCNNWIGEDKEKQFIFDNPTLRYNQPHDKANVKAAHENAGDCLLYMRSEIEELQERVSSLELSRGE